MESIGIGTSNVTTSRIGLGTWAIGGWMWGAPTGARSGFARVPGAAMEATVNAGLAAA